MHENPQPTEREQEQAPERVEEEDAMSGAGHESPRETVADPDPTSPDTA